MTQEQKEQLARQYADNTTPFGDHGGNNWRAAYNGYLAALDARDEEFALMKAEIEDDNAVMKQLKAELNKAKNPWVSVKDRLPEDGVDVFIKWGKNDPAQRLHGVGNHYSDGYLFPENNGWSINDVTHWMPIPQAPKGGEV